jgi:dGTPase
VGECGVVDQGECTGEWTEKVATAVGRRREGTVGQVSGLALPKLLPGCILELGCSLSKPLNCHTSGRVQAEVYHCCQSNHCESRPQMSFTDWRKLLNHDRLRTSTSPAAGDQDHEFLSDYYRVVFCSAFRRLQDKTQVSPLAPTDFVRRRLTHSVEVSVVGERMARVIANRLESHIGDNFRDPMGRIVATACLLHDIGNPPFGHEGELAIRDWADTHNIDSPDYRCFDGNAQGFRIAVRLQHQGKEYGLNLTAAVLSTVLKYPEAPVVAEYEERPLNKRGKWSVFSSEWAHYDRVTSLVGLPPGQRHPLCFVVEAADDIVNRLIDI